MSVTRYSLGSQELAYGKFSWPFYRGCAPRVVVIQQPAKLADKFRALPYINTLTISHSYGKGRNPEEGVITIPEVRLLEVREVNEDVCELHLADCRADLALIVNPLNVNIRLADGYLYGTRYERIGQFLVALANESQPFDAMLAKDAGTAADDAPLPDNLPLGGAMAPHALDRLAEEQGADFTVKEGKLAPATRADIDEDGAVPPIGSYLWLKGGRPSWMDVKRTQKGLPRTIRVHYKQRHAMRVALKARLEGSVVGRDVLLMGMEQVYSAGGKYLTLEQLLTTYGFESGDITDRQIALSIMSKNFEGTRIERLNGQATDADTETVISAIKRDWRRLYRLTFMDSAGRRGTWTDFVFGKFKTDADSDGSIEPSGAIDAAALESKWVEFVNVALQAYYDKQETLEGAIVATSHERPIAGQSLPSAPFSVAWEPGGEAEQVIRFTQTVLPDQNEALPGVLETSDGSGQLKIGLTASNTMTRDDGSSIPTDWNLQWPAKENAKFKAAHEAYVYMVAERQLPNTTERWTTYEEPGFAGGDIEFADIEVGSELFALYDYVDVAKGKLADPDNPTLGLQLNFDALKADSKRRADRYKRLLGAQVTGSGRSLGVVLAADVAVSGAINEIRIEVDGVNVSTVIECGNLGNPDAREKAEQRRADARRIITGGKRAI